MIKVSTSLPDIAVLRGGTADFKQSLKEGAEILQSLVKLGYHPLDVLIDTEGHWTAKGAPTDAHQIYVRAHTVIDTTRMKGEAYQDLAKRMGIPLLFSRAHEVTMDREDMYRILRQQGIKVPETTVIRAKSPLKAEQLRSIWSTYHTPLMIRPLKRVEGVPSKLIHGYHDLENTIRTYHDKGVDMHVLTYRKVPTASVALVPQFRNEKLYMPLWVETFTSMHEIPNNASRMQTYTRAPDFRKDQDRKSTRLNSSHRL